MINTDNLIKIKEYDTYVQFQHKDTGYMECFLKVDLFPTQEAKRKWER